MKRAVIVGATSGMGQEVAKLLVKEGWMVGIAGRRSEELAKFQALKPEQIVTETIDINAPDATEKWTSTSIAQAMAAKISLWKRA